MEVNEIIIKAHSSPGFHFKTKPTCKQIEENEYKWSNMKKSVREFYFNCKVCHQINQKPKKKVAVFHNPSWRPKERFVIDAVYLSDYIANEDRYLITMIDHFSKYGWAKLVKNKSVDLILLTIKLFYTFYGFPEILQSDNGKEFVNQKVENYLLKKQQQFIKGRPYHPQSKGSFKAFNKYIQNALISAKDHIKDKFNLEEILQDFYLFIIIQKSIALQKLSRLN